MAILIKSKIQLGRLAWICIGWLLTGIAQPLAIAQTENTEQQPTTAVTNTNTSLNTLLNNQTPNGEIQVQEQIVNGERVVKVTVTDENGTREFLHSSENQDFEIQVPVDAQGFDPTTGSFNAPLLPGFNNTGTQQTQTGGAASAVPPADYDFYLTMKLPKPPKKEIEVEAPPEVDPQEVQIEKEAASSLHLLKARQAYYKKDYKTALEEILRSIEIFPNTARNYEMLGSVYYRLKWEDLAVRNWQRALEFDPNNQRLIDFLARVDD